MRDILEVIKNVESIYNNNSSLAILKDFERVLDEMDMYVYKNWMDGELATGPKVDRHWVSAEFMWPREKMPDPMAAKRLMEMGCKVKYIDSHIIEPRKIRNPDDLRPGTKKGKLDTKQVWLVEIAMPRKLVFDIFNGYMDRIREEKKSKMPAVGNKATSPANPGAASATPAAPAAAPAAPGAPAGGAA
jgi:hypothetical protein